GAITEFLVPTAGSFPAEITAGPDGALWFTEQAGDKIGRITILSLEVGLDQSAFQAGDTLRVNVSMSNVGPAVTGDIYVFLKLPAAASPSLGCPGLDAAALVKSTGPGAIVRLSGPAQRVPRQLASVPTPA